MTSTEPGTRAGEAGIDGGPPGLLERLAGFSHRHRLAALGLWAAVLLAVQAVAGVVSSDYRNDFTLPGTESQQAQDILTGHGAAQAGDTLQIVFRDADGFRDGDHERRVTGMLRQVAALDGVAQVRSPYEDRGAVSDDGTTAYATVALDGKAEETPVADTRAVIDTARQAADDGLRVEVGGEAVRAAEEGGGGGAEGAGILGALVILVFLFGSLVAAALPVVTALFAVGSTMGLIVLASHLVTLADFTPPLMMLVGLGVGIDYALLVFSRYRSELLARPNPADPAAARERATRVALDAAGRTVFFAACTVVIALLGLVALGLGSLQGVAIAMALTVLVTMVASLTLLPALLGVFGPRIHRSVDRRAERRAARGRAEDGAAWRRWGAGVQRRPWAALLVAVAALGTLAVPAADLRLGFADAGNDPARSTARQAYDLLSEGFGPGFNGPLVVVADGRGAPARDAAGAAREALLGTPGVADASPPLPTGDPSAATLIVYPETSPQDEATADLVTGLRQDVLPPLEQQAGADFLVGGSTAAALDFADTVADRMPLFVALVVGLSALLLMAVFRSLLIPLKAAVLNLLSIGASLGVVTLVFQRGWLGAEPGPVEAFIPVMIFAIVFGLSMDYEVFLLSRIHEEWERTRDPAVAVREGLAHTGRVITAAAAIMIVVFAAFMLSPDRMLQQFGLGLAVAILLDAVVIRCLIVPAVMQLLGRRAWWLPRPLARALPAVRLERH